MKWYELHKDLLKQLKRKDCLFTISILDTIAKQDSFQSACKYFEKLLRLTNTDGLDKEEIKPFELRVIKLRDSYMEHGINSLSELTNEIQDLSFLIVDKQTVAYGYLFTELTDEIDKTESDLLKRTTKKTNFLDSSILEIIDSYLNLIKCVSEIFNNSSNFNQFYQEKFTRLLQEARIDAKPNYRFKITDTEILDLTKEHLTKRFIKPHTTIKNFAFAVHLLEKEPSLELGEKALSIRIKSLMKNGALDEIIQKAIKN